MIRAPSSLSPVVTPPSSEVSATFNLCVIINTRLVVTPPSSEVSATLPLKIHASQGLLRAICASRTKNADLRGASFNSLQKQHITT